MRIVVLLLSLVAFGAHAAINGTVVQTGQEGNAGLATITVNSGSTDALATPTSGNILMAITITDNDGATVTIDSMSGWTRILNEDNTNMSYAIDVKVSAGTETSISGATTGTPADMSLTILEWDDTDLDTDTANWQYSEDISDIATAVTSSGTPSATNSTADSLVLYIWATESGHHWDTPATMSVGTQQSANWGLVNTFRPVPGVASEVVSTSASRSSTLTDTNQSGKVVSALVIIPAAAGAGPTVTLSDATPDIDTTVTATLSGAFGAGGNPATVTFSGGDTVSCSSATSTSCDFPLNFSALVAAGDLGTTQAGVADTITITNGTETSQATAINIQISASGYAIVDLTCTAGVDCSADSKAISPMIAGDDCAIKVTSGTLNHLSTECAPVFDTPSWAYTVARFDESAVAWLAQEAVVVDAPPAAGGGMKRVKIKGVRMGP